MKSLLKCLILITSNILVIGLIAQPLLVQEKNFYLNSVWQEYMPEVYSISDSMIVTAGLNTNLNTLSMNIFLRWMHVDGTVVREKEIFNIDNPEGFSFDLPSFNLKSAIDDDFIYLIAVSAMPL